MKTFSDAIEPQFPERDSGWAEKRGARSRVRFLATALATIFIVWGLQLSFPTLKYRIRECMGLDGDEAVSSSLKSFDWDDIKATESLEFHPCYGPFECAKLKLPLDYFNSAHPDSSVSIAIAKLPAKVPVDDPRYGGPVLINPGGPGGSGVMTALGMGHYLQTVIDAHVHPDNVDDSKGKYFDILGFDPRGIGYTEPAAMCISDGAAAWSWRLREAAEGHLDSSDAALGRLWAMTHAFGASCKEAVDAEDEPDIKQFMSTASVARDMLEIAEKHAELVAEQKTQLRLVDRPHLPKCPKSEITKYEPGTVKLQYMGFSYGTYLGATFASMFPERVGRLSLDGVVNSDDYNNALGEGSLRDTEKVMKAFYTFCLLSGPENCALATPTSSAHDIERRVQSIINSLYHRPIAVSLPDEGPDLLTYSDVRSLIFHSFYSPALTFPMIAEILTAIEAGQSAVIERLVAAFRSVHIYTCPTTLPFYSDTTTYAVLCSDSVDQTSVDIGEMEKYWHALEKFSPSAGAYWSMLKMKCTGWKIKASYKYTGEFGGNTSHPILWLSTTADPVTPLHSARIMSNRFPGSVVLIQDSAGHCSLSTPTPCTEKAIREYFQSGSLPDPEQVCIPPKSPLSLNSTDPNSPFYDPSLGERTFLGEEVWSAEEEEAARGLQMWAAENEWFGMGYGSERIGGMMKSWLAQQHA